MTGSRRRGPDSGAPPGAHLSPAEFAENGRTVLDWLARYWSQIEDYPVLSRVRPGEIRGRLPDAAPEAGESFEDVMRDLDRIVVPGLTHWQSPSFFAFFPSNNSGPSVLGELLAAGLGVQGMLWATSPACTELETHVLDWLVDLLALPPAFRSDGPGGGVIQDTASSATLTALLAARERATGFESNRIGVRAPLVAYGSEESHSSLLKAVRIAGLGGDNLRSIPADPVSRAARPEAFAAQVREDLAAGRIPCFVTVTLGTTSTGAFDPLEAMGRIARDHGIWVHVDAAMSGTAFLCPEFRHLQAGLEFADSYCFNPHKWMFTNFDCDAFWVRDRRALIETLSVTPEYLRNRASDAGEVLDYRDWHIPLGRRFRALKLWLVLRHYGAAGLRDLIREHVALGQEFRGWVEAADDFEVLTPAPLNHVTFRYRRPGVPLDDLNRRLLDAVNESGRLYLTHTRVPRGVALRMVVAQTNTTRSHVRQAWDRITRTARALP